MSTQFEVVDWADTTTHPSRGLAGQVASGQDYLAALSERVPTEFAELRAVEVQLRGPDRAAIISRHPGGAHSITHWLRRNDGWRASILILNVPDDVVARVRNPSPFR